MNSKETLQRLLNDILLESQAIRIQQVQATNMWSEDLKRKGNEEWLRINNLHKEASQLIKELP